LANPDFFGEVAGFEAAGFFVEAALVAGTAFLAAARFLSGTALVGACFEGAGAEAVRFTVVVPPGVTASWGANTDPV
jgi:hypothetical protein